MVQQSIVNAKGQRANRNPLADIWGRAEQREARRDARTPLADHLAYEDYVTLADGQVVIVPRGNLAAAKGLLAAQRAAERRVAAQHAERDAAQLAAFGAVSADESGGAMRR